MTRNDTKDLEKANSPRDSIIVPSSGAIVQVQHALSLCSRRAFNCHLSKPERGKITKDTSTWHDSLLFSLIIVKHFVFVFISSFCNVIFCGSREMLWCVNSTSFCAGCCCSLSHWMMSSAEQLLRAKSKSQPSSTGILSRRSPRKKVYETKPNHRKK